MRQIMEYKYDEAHVEEVAPKNFSKIDLWYYNSASEAELDGYSACSVCF